MAITTNVYEEIFKTAGLGVAKVGIDGRWIEVNDKLCSMLQYSKEELLTKTFKDITHQDDLAANLNAMKQMYDRTIDKYTTEKRYYKKDGSLIWVQLTANLVIDEHNNLNYFIAIIEDITDKVKSREESLNLKKQLEKKEKLLSNIINEIPDVLVIKDKEGKFTLGNKTVSELYGTTPENMIGKYDSDFGVPKKLSDDMRSNVLSIMKKGKTQIVYEDSLDAKTGAIRHFKSIKKPFKTLNGEDNILVIAHDITDLIKKEQALKKSEEKLNDILELVGEGVWQWDMVTNTVTHNHQWCKLLGLSDDLLEHRLDFFASKIVPEHKDMVFERLQNALKNNTEYFSRHKLLKGDGSAFWVEDHGKIVQKDEKNNPTMMVGAIRDITAEKELEEYSKNLNEALRNLRQKEHELNDYLKSASDFVWEVNTNGLFTKVSNGIIDILGDTHEEILNMTPFDMMEEDEAIRIKSIFDDLVKDEKPIKELKNWVVAKDGTKHCMITNGIPFYDEDGLFMGYRGTDRDITRLKEQEETIVKQEKRALMGDMLENIAHQWRQPLSVITTSATGIQVQKEYGLLDDQHLESELDSIKNAAIHLSNTIDDFRSFYKNEAVATEFNLCKAIDKSLMLMSSKFKNREIEVIKKLEDINIVGFKNEMIQVFMNILSNAQDELQNINNQKRIIIIETKHTQDHIEISFQDNAGGVPNDIIDNIFIQNFTTKADQDGTGIGLFMSKNIIEKLNGTLEVENKEFKIDDNLYIGAKFTVTLHIN